MVNTNLMFCVNMQPAKGIWNCGVMVMGGKVPNNLVLATGYMQAT